MAEIVNLRQARKLKAQAEKERQAETNRALFGRTKSEKQVIEKTRARKEEHLDAHRLNAGKDEVE